MAGKIFVCVLTLLVFYGAECTNPPNIIGSFIAWGEIVQPILETDGFNMQINFEESYKAETEDAAFFLWFAGKNLTFIKNQNINQTFLYIETDAKKIVCLETSETEWVESDFEASLLSYEDENGTIKFSLKQLFDIPPRFLTDKLRGAPTMYRGIPANAWNYEIKTTDQESGNVVTLNITSYWANGTFDTSAGRKMSPLGYKISKLISSTPVFVEDYVINVYGFVHDAYDHKYFKAVEGVVCPNRMLSLKFPNVGEIRAISLHSEMALPDYQEVRYFDTWFDPGNKLLRMDIERMKDEDPLERKLKRYQSEISIGKLGVVYRYGWVKGESSCEIVPFDKYEYDFQNLFDIKMNNWKIGKLFGLDDTAYTYIGKTRKNDIPCHVFQGTRQDWPEKTSGVISLWEWCFNVNMSSANDIMMFENDEFGLISAQVKILSAPDPKYNNYRMNHHFYGVKAQDPKMLDSTSFDIGRCYTDLEKRGLQFYLNTTLDHNTRMLAENATSDISFLQKWKAAIYSSAQLPVHSLRVSNVRSTIDGDKMHIKFYILDVHKDLPDDVKKDMISAVEAKRNLQESINAGNLSITHEWIKGERVSFKAVEDSLTYQIDPKFDPQTVPPITSTSTGTSVSPFTLKTDRPIKRIARYAGNQPGAVAGVSIAMLLVGVTIGSGATFYKFNGLPAFLRR